MSQEQRTLLAISLMLGLIILYQTLFAPKRPPEKPPAVPAASQPAVPAPSPAAAPAPAGGGEAPEREVRVETNTLSLILTTRGGGVKSWRLKDYVVADKGPLDIVSPVAAGVAPPLAAWGYEGLPALEAYAVDKTSLHLSGKEEGAVVFTRKGPTGLRMEKHLRFRGDAYTADGEVRLRNESAREVAVDPKTVWGPGFHESRDKAKAGAQHAPTMWLDGQRLEESLKDAKPGVANEQKGTVAWIALHDTYFAAALIPESTGAVAFAAVAEDGQPMVGLRGARESLRPGQEAVFRFKVYGGPKRLNLLATAAPALDRLVDLRFSRWAPGIFNEAFEFGLARPALYLLQFLRNLTGNYGLAIILLTVLVKAVMFPLTQKSLKSMQGMQALQPKIQAIKEKYKNNPQKRNQEMADLMRRHKVSGAAGCLPMLAQMPIFIALYYALSNSVDLWQAHFLWVKDLSAPEHGLFALPAGVPFFGGTEFRPLPLLMGATQFLQMKLSPSGADPHQAAVMTYFMPVFMTFIFYSFPAGLALYWFCFNVLQIGQQYLLNRARAQAPATSAG